MTAGPLRSRRLIWAVAVPLALAGLGALAGGVVAAATPVTYTASATVFVSSTSASTSLDEASDLQAQVRTSYADVVTAPIVLRQVIARLHLHESLRSLAGRVTARPESGTAVIRIEARDPAGVRAAAIADAVADRLVAVVPSLTPSSGSQAPQRLTTIMSPKVPLLPSSPDLPVDLLIGALAGGVLGAGIVLGTTAARRPSDGTAPSMF